MLILIILSSKKISNFSNKNKNKKSGTSSSWEKREKKTEKRFKKKNLLIHYTLLCIITLSLPYCYFIYTLLLSCNMQPMHILDGSACVPVTVTLLPVGELEVL